MSKHTPGLWNYYDDSNDGKTNRIEIVAVGKTIAHIYNSVTEEDLPNARLIAAAPELLEALSSLISQLNGFQECNGDKGFDLVGSLAAIAKATGETA